jgi:hypothetical protein
MHVLCVWEAYDSTPQLYDSMPVDRLQFCFFVQGRAKLFSQRSAFLRFPGFSPNVVT